MRYATEACRQFLIVFRHESGIVGGVSVVSLQSVGCALKQQFFSYPIHRPWGTKMLIQRWAYSAIPFPLLAIAQDLCVYVFVYSGSYIGNLELNLPAVERLVRIASQVYHHGHTRTKTLKKLHLHFKTPLKNLLFITFHLLRTKHSAIVKRKTY